MSIKTSISCFSQHYGSYVYNVITKSSMAPSGGASSALPTVFGAREEDARSLPDHPIKMFTSRLSSRADCQH
nr:hypothetical protein BgiMline_023471 [Biomphalaria glabrata]